MSKVKEKFSGSLALTKLVHVKMTKKGKNGMVEGLFIPIDHNYFIRGKMLKDDGGKDIPGSEPIYLNLDVVIFNEKSHGQDGMLPQKVGSKVWKEASDEEKEKINKLPILGNFKKWDNEGSNESSGNAEEGKVFEESDDLPF